MCLDRSALVLLFSKGLCHRWSRLKQGELGCKISLAGQSQALAAPKWPEMQQNKQQVWGVLLRSRVTFSVTLPNLGLAALGFLGNSTLCGGQVPAHPVLPCTGMVLC